MRFVNLWCTLKGRLCEKRRTIILSRYWRKISFFERLKSVRKRLLTFFTLTDGYLKKKGESLIKHYIKVTCALKWARKLPRKESAKCVPCSTRKCTHNGFVSDLLKWTLKCKFYATGPRSALALELETKESFVSLITKLNNKTNVCSYIDVSYYPILYNQTLFF